MQSYEHMRYQADHKAQTHQRIVKDASRQLRRAGLGGSGVARIMKASGLTHGGFYKHFRSKNDLLVEAVDEAFSQQRAQMMRRAQEAPAGQRWKAIINWYLSEDHCAHPDTGCPLAALGPELSRIDGASKKRVAEALRTHRANLVAFMPGERTTDREHAFSVIMPAMLGTLQIARLMPDPDMRKHFLKNTRELILRSFD